MDIVRSNSKEKFMSEMSEIKIIEGEVFRDERGRINSLNDFHFDGVRRCYFICHPDPSVVRGWHGHQHERKWFSCVKGDFTLACVKIDDWEHPSPELKPEIFRLSDERSCLVCVPEGYANCLKTTTAGSIMAVFSDKILPDAFQDSWRYDKNLWVDWSKY